MIDNEKEAYELIEALNEHLPMRAYATLPLVKALRRQGADIQVNDAVKIDSVLYLGDEGGVACSIGLPGGKTVVVTSITHLRIDSDHPLARRIQAYQLRRSQHLEGPKSRSSRRSRASLATKPKRKRVRVAPNEAATKNDLKLRLRTACRFWESGEYKLAADSFREVFDLEHDDPYFSRYWLASCLFQLGSFDELDKLLQQQDDHSGIWRFAQALEAFRLHGDTEDAQRLLVEADHLEPGFEHYLLRDKVVDACREVRFDAGDAERSFGCARLFLPAWRGCQAPQRGPGESSKSRPLVPIRTMCPAGFRGTNCGHCRCVARPGKSVWCRVPTCQTTNHVANMRPYGCSAWPMSAVGRSGR